MHSKVRLRVERERVCGDTTVPGGGTTLGKPCGVVCWVAVLLVLVVEVTLPVELLLPVPLASFESSRLKENLFGLRLKLATLFVTYSCRELKKLIFVAYANATSFFFFVSVFSLCHSCSDDRGRHRLLLFESWDGSSLVPGDQDAATREIYRHRSCEERIGYRPLGS